jgi:DNA repair exonuclease SbcCD ATPase subunit
MKNRTIRKIAARLVAAATAVTLICAAQAQEKKSVTVDLKEIRKGLTELQARVADNASALDGIKKAAKDKSDLKTPYSTFAQSFKKLESQIEILRSQATQMRARADDHYKAWKDELSKMGNPKLREKAQNRFAEAKEEFDEIIVVADEAKRSLEPYLADLRDVNQYLSADLSHDAVKSLNNTIWKLGNKSGAVIASIQHVNTQIGKALEVQPEGK